MRTMEHTEKTGSAVAVVCVSLLVLAFFASPAVASRGRVFGGSFGVPGSGAGNLSLSPAGTQSAGSGVAVDDITHDVYIADTGNHRVDEFTAKGAFIRAWGWGVSTGASEPQTCTIVCRQGLSGTAPGQFAAPALIAVDNSPGGEGDVYVADAGEFSAGDSLVQKFTSEGVLVETWGVKGQISRNPTTAATLTGDITSGSSEVTGFEVTSGELTNYEISGEGIPADTQIFEWNTAARTIRLSKPATATNNTGVTLTLHQPFKHLAGIAVDAAGDLWVADKNGGGPFEFSQSGAFIQNTETLETPTSLAINFATGELYASENGFEVVKFDANADVLGYVFATEEGQTGMTGLAVNSATGDLYVDEGDSIAVVSPSCVPIPPIIFSPPFCPAAVRFGSPQLTGGAGLAVEPQSDAVYAADTTANRIDAFILEPSSAPTVEAGSESVLNISADSATFSAEVNPRSEPNEESTSYTFEYGPCATPSSCPSTYESSVPSPDGQLAPNYEPDTVTAHAQGLQPNTVYHYRLVAHNSHPSVTHGEELTFTTQATNVFALPDERAWELVSPPNKHSAKLNSIGSNGVIQASADGNAIAYLATAPTESAPPGNSNNTQVLSTRVGAGVSSWGSRDISTPRDVANGFNEATPEEYRFFSTDLSDSVVKPFGALAPSLSVEASEQTVFLRTDYPGGEPNDPCLASCYRPLVTGAPGFANVPEGTHFSESGGCGRTECGVIFLGANPDGSHIVLTSDAVLTEGAPANSLYEWVGGQLQLVSVLPESAGGEPAGGEPTLGKGNSGVLRNAISTDGSRVAWQTNHSVSRLYLRDVVREETVQLGGVGAEYQTASSDDSRVFFTMGGDLYLFEAPLGGALSAGHTMDLAPDGAVQGLVAGTSEDGSSVYFVGKGVLTGIEANEHGEKAVAGQPNLYLYRAGVTKLIAVLSGAEGSSLKDVSDWSGREAGSESPTVRVSPNGRWLAFMSERSLTGYDNRDASNGQRDNEVFLYDANGNGGDGRLVCASCDPTGARPHGVFDSGTVAGTLLVDRQHSVNHVWLAANVPVWTSPFYQSRYLSDSGRLFFNSPDALVPSDTNGVEDVYEFEPPGVGGCSNESATFSAHSGGCVDLISSGTSKEESAFLDASESGDDVFFLTSAQLASQDTDTVLDVYDARVDGGFAEFQRAPACEGDACQSPVAAPNDPTPGSLTFQGPGNPGPSVTVKKVAKKKTVKCQKGKRLSHGKCVKKAKDKSKKTAKKTGKLSNKRRTK
ncbi:MAG: hypothetical protein WAN93_01770 [Solirubrobacteraceae bacterium]